MTGAHSINISHWNVVIELKYLSVSNGKHDWLQYGNKSDLVSRTSAFSWKYISIFLWMQVVYATASATEKFYNDLEKQKGEWSNAVVSLEWFIRTDSIDTMIYCVSSSPIDFNKVSALWLERETCLSGCIGECFLTCSFCYCNARCFPLVTWGFFKAHLYLQTKYEQGDHS